MTLHTPRPPVLPVSAPAPRTGSELFGTLVAEVVAPAGPLQAPELLGWEVRLWQVARLGDATLEARPLYPHLEAADLQEALARAGWSVLGPLRSRR